jgi:hypothetical protein
MNTFLKVLGTIGLLLLGLVGLLMSLCGGIFTVSALGGGEMTGFLVISIPSLALGLTGLVFAARRLRRRFAAPAQG